MLLTNTNFDAKHVLSNKIPIYLIHFAGETTDYVNHAPGSPDNTCKNYLINISGLDQAKTPQEGRSTVGLITFELLDYDNEITALLATDATSYFHRRKTTVKAGYLGMAEADMLTISSSFRVTGLSLTSDGLAYTFEITDPSKWMDKTLFVGSEDDNIIIEGNAIDIILRILTSSGTPGTNGDYDVYAAANGLDLDSTDIDIAGIEAVRDDYYPGNSHYLKFTIDGKEKAIDWLEKELFKLLNLTPALTNDGRFTLKPFKPPIAAYTEVQTFDEDVIIGMPGLDFNLGSMVNEIAVEYDHDGDDYQINDYHVDSTSLANRGPGKEMLLIQSKGLRSAISGASLNLFAADVSTRRATSVFRRYATPPLKLTLESFFTRWLTEVGDVVPFTHSKLPDIVAGTLGLTSERMEVLQRDVDWLTGKVKFVLEASGFARNIYQAVSPTMTITAVADQENFTVSAADAAKFAHFTSPEVQILTANMVQKVASVTILSVNATTGAIKIDSAGTTLYTGWVVMFAEYDNCTADQKKYGFIADGSNQLGTDNDDAHYII